MFDHEVAELAEHQQGLISRDQVLQLGGTPAMIRHRLDHGRWRTVHHGVFALAGVPETDELVLRAACLATGPGSALSHRTATDRWLERALQLPVELTTPREIGRIATTATVHRSRDLAPEHVTHRRGWPVTTPTRTLVDLGQVVPIWRVDEVVELFLSRKLVTIPQVRAAIVVHSRQGRRGVGVLRRVLADRALGDRPADSVLEAALAHLCREGGLPPPVFQHRVVVGGHERSIDFAYPDLHLAIEVDGYEFHSAPSQFEVDRVRGNELALAGWQVLHFTWDQVVHRPRYVLETIRRALRDLGRKLVARGGPKNPRTPGWAP